MKYETDKPTTPNNLFTTLPGYKKTATDAEKQPLFQTSSGQKTPTTASEFDEIPLGDEKKKEDKKECTIL